MIITCEACHTSFNLDDKMVKPTGSKVRCSVCSNVFTAYPPQAPTPEPPTPPVEADAGALLDDGGELDIEFDEASEARLSTADIDDAVSDALNEELSDTATLIADLDDDDLDLSLDGSSEAEETVIADLEMEDFDLENLTENDGDPQGSETIIADLDDDELDLDGDFTREAEDTVQLKGFADAGSPATVDEIDDLDLTLDLDHVDAEAVATSAESTGLEDDLDLSSLESLLQDDMDSEEDAVTMVVDGGEEPELSLDLGDEATLTDADVADETDDSLEALELDLDGSSGAGAFDGDDAAIDDQELDLSEIEKMLEDPQPESAKFSSLPEQDHELDVEASLDTEKWMSESGEEEQLVADDELDLTELEQVLEDVDTEAMEDTTEEPELELDLDVEENEALVSPSETVAVDNELEFDLSEFEDVSPSTSDASPTGDESGDMALEFEVEAPSQEHAFEDEDLEATVAVPEPAIEEAGAVTAGTAVAAAPVVGTAPVKRGMSKWMIFLLIIAILGGGGYGTYYLLEKNNIEIPFLSDYLKPKVDDPGNLKLTTYDINSRFVDNANVGKLFVISGKVKNGYTNNRGMVTLMGSIFSTNKALVQQEKVYCGNIMSDLELANLEWDEVKARQSNRLGDNRSNVKIEPGASIPFMVVFSDLPDDLEEFSIEVTGSTSLK